MSGRRYELTDREWSIIAPLLPDKPRGVPRVDDRRMLNGILWRFRTGSPWAEVSERYGPSTTCYNRFTESVQHHVKVAHRLGVGEYGEDLPDLVWEGRRPFRHIHRMRRGRQTSNGNICQDGAVFSRNACSKHLRQLHGVHVRLSCGSRFDRLPIEDRVGLAPCVVDTNAGEKDLSHRSLPRPVWRKTRASSSASAAAAAAGHLPQSPTSSERKPIRHPSTCRR